MKRILPAIFCLSFPAIARAGQAAHHQYSYDGGGKEVPRMIMTSAGSELCPPPANEMNKAHFAGLPFLNKESAKEIAQWQTLRDMAGGDAFIYIPNGSILSASTSIDTPQVPTPQNPTNKNVFYFSPEELKFHNGNGTTASLELIDADNDVSISPYNGSLLFERHTQSALTARPIINLVYENSSANIQRNGGGGMFDKLPPFSIHSYQDPGAYGSLDGLSMWLVDQSNGVSAPYNAQSQALDATIFRAGYSSTWGFSLSHRDTTGVAPSSFSQTYAELDGSANGPDTGIPPFNPSGGNRKAIWIQSGSEDYYFRGIGKRAVLVQNGSWTTNMAVTAGQRIRVLASDNRFHLYEAITSGRTGSSAPRWIVSSNTYLGNKGKLIPGSTVKDGSVTWMHLSLFNAGFSKAIFLDGNNYRGTGGSWFDVGITSNSHFYGAFIDTSQASFIDPTTSFTVSLDSRGNTIKNRSGETVYRYTPSIYGAALRMAPDQNIDFSSSGTLESLNSRRLSYISSDKSLEYLRNNAAYLSIADTSAVSMLGYLTIGTGKQAYLSMGAVYPEQAMIFGKGLWDIKRADSDILGGAAGLMLGTLRHPDGRPNTIPALEIQSNNHVLLHDVIQLAAMKKEKILAIPNPAEGMKAYDSDNHEEVTYRCPAGSACGWYPTQYGTMLRN